MNLGRVGGILEAKKIASMAEVDHVQIAPHLYCGPVVGAANIQLATCSPNFLIQESIETWQGFHAAILKKPIRWSEGYIIPPTEPGLGVELNEDYIKGIGNDGSPIRDGVDLRVGDTVVVQRAAGCRISAGSDLAARRRTTACAGRSAGSDSAPGPTRATRAKGTARARGSATADSAARARGSPTADGAAT